MIKKERVDASSDPSILSLLAWLTGLFVALAAVIAGIFEVCKLA